MALWETVKSSDGNWTKITSSYFESVTSVLFNYSPYFVGDALSEIIISHYINCFNFVCWEKDLATFQRSGAVKAEFFRHNNLAYFRFLLAVIGCES